MRPACASCDTIEPLPRIARSGPPSAFNARTPGTTSSLMRVVFFQDACFMVLENTTFGRLFIPSATSGTRCLAASVGQKLAIIS